MEAGRFGDCHRGFSVASRLQLTRIRTQNQCATAIIFHTRCRDNQSRRPQETAEVCQFLGAGWARNGKRKTTSTKKRQTQNAERRWGLTRQKLATPWCHGGASLYRSSVRRRCERRRSLGCSCGFAFFDGNATTTACAAIAALARRPRREDLLFLTTLFHHLKVVANNFSKPAEAG